MKKKVLFVIESLGGGGAEKVLSTIIKHMNKSKFEITLCTIVNVGKYIDEVRPYVKYVSVLKLPEKNTVFDKILYKLKYRLVYSWLPMSLVYRLFIPKKNDIEIAFCEGFVTKLIAKSSNKNAVRISWVHIDLKHNPWTQNLAIYRNIAEETKTYSKFDKIVTVSKTVEKSFKEVYGQLDKVVTIYNPIDVRDIKQKSNASIESYDHNIINMVAIGRLVPQKGFDILLHVVRKLKDDGYKFVLRILGEGKQYYELLDYINKYNLHSYVKLIGFKNNPYPYIVGSDLFVCSSRSEGYSLVIAESLVLGVPVVSTYCSGPNELLDEGKYGMLVENDEDGRGLYEGLKLFFNDKDLLYQYRQKTVGRWQTFILGEVMRIIEKNLMNL